MVQVYTALSPLLERIKALFKKENFKEKLIIRNSIFEIDKDYIVITDSATALKILSERVDLKVMALSDMPSFSEGQALLQQGIKGYANTYIHTNTLNRLLCLLKVVISGSTLVLCKN